MPKVNGQVPMPPVPDPKIMGMLMEIGLHQSTGMGIAPLSWSEIQAWAQMTRTLPSPADVRLIRQLSVEYVAESHRADDENAPPPWRAPISEAEANLEEQRLRMLLG